LSEETSKDAVMFAPFASVRSIRRVSRLFTRASERQRTRANAEPRHSCHASSESGTPLSRTVAGHDSFLGQPMSRAVDAVGSSSVGEQNALCGRNRLPVRRGHPSSATPTTSARCSIHRIPAEQKERKDDCVLKGDAIPIRLVWRVETGAVTPSVTKDEVGALPTVAVRPWPRMIEHGNSRR
jgi:hypothetical protein